MPTLKTLLPCPLQAILGTLSAVSRTDHLSQSNMPHNIPNLLTSLGAPCSDGPRQCLPCPQPTYPLLHGSQKAWIPFRQTHTCMQHASAPRPCPQLKDKAGSSSIPLPPTGAESPAPSRQGQLDCQPPSYSVPVATGSSTVSLFKAWDGPAQPANIWPSPQAQGFA